MEEIKLVDGQGIPVKLRFTRVETVVPSDTVTFPPGNLYIGGAGDVKLKASGDNDWHTFKGLGAGDWLAGEIIAVHTDTTATYILVCY